MMPRRLGLAFAAALAAASLSSPGFAGPQEPDDKDVDAAIVRLLKTTSFRRKQPASPAEVELGKKLFGDPRLSASGKMSCATCHVPERRFQDDLPRAIGRDGKPVARNTPSLLEASFYAMPFWDGRAETLDEASLIAAQNPQEMNQPLPGLVAKVRALPEYAPAFAGAYPEIGVSSRSIGAALGAYVASLAAPADSPFDVFVASRSGLSAQAKRGFMVFVDRANCIACHSSTNFNYSDRFNNIGLAPLGSVDDPGRYRVEPRARMWGAFRVPSLRNVALTAPYMHDGRFKTLEEVVDFYDRGGDGTRYQDHAVRPIGLSSQEREDLLAFLRALTSASLAGESVGKR